MAAFASAPAAPDRRLPWLLALAATLLAAAALRVALPPDTDGVWLLTAAGRMLDGAAPYRDIVEPNPPASLLLYVPAALLARWTGLPPTAMSDALVAAVCGGSVAASVAALGRARVLGSTERLTWGIAALAILLVLPLGTFGQREHVATAALLPALAALAGRRAGEAPRAGAALGIGVAAGLAIAVKPIFGLAFAGPLLCLARERGWRAAFLPELVVAVGVAGAYAVGVVALCPDYADRMLPLLRSIYLPARLPLPALLVSPMADITLLLGVSFWLLRARAGVLGTTLALASAGLLACIAIQGKGFAYHGLPAILTMTLALAAALLRESAPPRTTALRLAPALVALGLTVPQLALRDPPDSFAPGLTAAVASGPAHGRLLMIGETAELGPAFADAVGDSWVASAPFAWVTLYASLIAPHPERDPRLAALIAAERDRFAADIVREKPDTVVVEDDGWLAWARRSSTLAAALGAYHEAGRYGPAILMRRTDAP